MPINPPAVNRRNRRSSKWNSLATILHATRTYTNSSLYEMFCLFVFRLRYITRIYLLILQQCLHQRTSVRVLQQTITVTNALIDSRNADFFYYPRDAMLARSLRQRRVRTSVCLAVTRRYCA